MKARHKKAKGGGVYYSGGGSQVAKEAAQKKRGGGVEMGKIKGAKSKMRMDKRPRRAAGGRVGSDKSPFSSSAYPAPKSES